MSQVAQIIHRTIGGPVTSNRIRADLDRLGVQQGDALLVHASLSALGFVPGGAQAVVAALTAAVGSAGLVTVPAFTTHLSDPVNWHQPPVPPEWFDAIRADMAPFEADRSPSRGMGALAEQLRTTPGALRSAHPHVSFAALGARAREIVQPHPLECWLGDGSPLQRLYDLDAKVLLLGTAYETCTAFHLAEHRAGVLHFIRSGAPLLVDGSRHWIAFDAPDYDTSGFEALGNAFEAASSVACGRVGMANCRVFSLRSAVDFASTYFRRQVPAGAVEAPPLPDRRLPSHAPENSTRQGGDVDYDLHGGGYATQRRPDPRIAAILQAALGNARTVLNVGAGAGSYEPPDRFVIAVEPSATMRRQRPAHLTPAIEAVAENLPLRDRSVDASMALSTVHQWRDLRAGLRELRRVTRGPVIVLTFDPEALGHWWLARYVPELVAAEQRRVPSIERIRSYLGGMTAVATVPIPCDCTDGFTDAFYGRPERLLDPAVRSAQSCWHFVPQAVQDRFAAELSRDLQSGAWDREYGALRRLDTFDGSLRLVIGIEH